MSDQADRTTPATAARAPMVPPTDCRCPHPISSASIPAGVACCQLARCCCKTDSTPAIDAAQVSLGDRLSVALGSEPPDACPGDLAIAAETAVVEWMRETAQRLRYDDDIAAAVLLDYARRIENGDA